MATPTQPPRKEEEQSGRQVAFVIGGFFVGTIVLLMAIKALLF